VWVPATAPPEPLLLLLELPEPLLLLLLLLLPLLEPLLLLRWVPFVEP
jgi:hypothetical protein